MLKENGLVLSVDGSGVPSYKHPSKEYCISGVVTSRKNFERLNFKISKICKKYFGDEDAILHFTEISRKIGIFDSLKDPEYEIKFWSEMISLIDQKNITLIYGLIDKSLAKKRGWQQITLAEMCYESVIKSFLKILRKQKCGGQIITESDLYTDDALIKVHNRFQLQGVSKLKVSSKAYHRTITSLSLVNKHNLDSAVQMSDLLGFTARLMYRLKLTDSKLKIPKLQMKLLKLIDRKISKKEALYEVI